MAFIHTQLNESRNDLKFISESFRLYDFDSVKEIQEHLNMKRAVSNFDVLYLIDEDDRLYRDNYIIKEEWEHIFNNYFTGN